MKLISVAEATDLILATVPTEWSSEYVPLERATGRVLREDLRADRDFPPFDRVMMDGIALRYADWAAGRRDFTIEGIVGAGAPPLPLTAAGGCLEIMTGAVLPAGCDTVIRYEDLTIADGQARVDAACQPRPGQNIHRRGNDRRQGEVVVPSGTLLSAGEIGVAATVGRAELAVSRLPRIMIVSTGDELVPVTATPLPHQIRRSNVHQLAALLTGEQLTAATSHLPDEPETLQAAIADFLARYDILLLSGGVSKGRYDYVPEVLRALGVEPLFHGVRQRPGKPFWFGRHSEGCRVFALPGNPVSGFVCTLRYVLPWWRQTLGLAMPPQRWARLSEDFSFQPALVYFLPVQLQEQASGQRLAIPRPGQGSGDLANLVDVDAFMELPADRTHFSAGEAFPIYPFRERG